MARSARFKRPSLLSVFLAFMLLHPKMTFGFSSSNHHNRHDIMNKNNVLFKMRRARSSSACLARRRLGVDDHQGPTAVATTTWTSPRRKQNVKRHPFRKNNNNSNNTNLNTNTFQPTKDNNMGRTVPSIQPGPRIASSSSSSSSSIHDLPTMRLRQEQVLAWSESILAHLSATLHSNSSTTTTTTRNNMEISRILSQALDCLAMCADLGNGTLAARFYDQLLLESQYDVDDDDHFANDKTGWMASVEWRMQAARHVLHAWCQQVRQQRRRRRPLQPPPQQRSLDHYDDDESTSPKDANVALTHALTSLTYMELLQQQQRSSLASPQQHLSSTMIPSPPPFVSLLQARDYQTVLQAALDLGQVSNATEVLLTRWAAATNTLTTLLPPTRQDYMRIMRAWSYRLHHPSNKQRGANHHDDSYYYYQDETTSTSPLTVACQMTRLGQSFLSHQKEYDDNYYKKDELVWSVTEDLDLINIMLDAWSKVLPKVGGVIPLTTLSSSSASTASGVSGDDDEAVARHVKEQASILWRQVQQRWGSLLEKLQDNRGNKMSNGLLLRQAKFLMAKSFTLMIYIYCKCHQLEQAWNTWKELVAFLLKVPFRNQEAHRVDEQHTNVRRQAQGRRFAHGGYDRVDSRSFRVLVQVIVREIQALEDCKQNSDHGSPVDSNICHRQQIEWAERAIAILDGMWTLDGAGYDDVAPDVYLYTTVITAWTLVMNPVMGSIGTSDIDSTLTSTNAVPPFHPAHHLLCQLEARYQQQTSIDRQRQLQPDVALYNAVLQAIVGSNGRKRKRSRIFEARSFIERMQIKSLDNPKVAPDTITYNILLDGCVKCSMSDDQDSAVGLKHAEQALSWMEIEFQTGNKRIKPNYRSYSIVIQGFLNAGDTSKAEDWLDRMEERYVPTAKLFHSLIETCCRQVTNNDAALKGASLDVQEKQKQRQEALRAQRILIRMEELYRVTGTSNLLPDKALYDMVSQAWSDIGEDSLSTEQLENLRRSKDRLNDFLPNQSGDEQIESPSFTFTSPEQVIALLDNPDDREVSTLGFNKVLKQMADASVDSNTLAGQQAENILDFMIHLHSTGGADGQQLKPDIISFNTVVRAWAKTSHPQSAKRAEAVLQKLSKLHETGLLLDLQPDRITFNTIIHAYAKLGATNDADRVLRLLETMHRTTNEEKYQPDVVSYSTMLNAWANSNKQGAANHAEQVLLRMHEAHKANPGSCPAPNTECFNEVLYAWARSSEENAAKRSEMVMRLMEDMSKASGNDMVKPTTRSYNIVLYALAKSHDSDIDAPFRAQMILEKMKKAARSGELWMKPDHVSYTTVISAWCRLGGRQALDATERLVREACESRSAITVDDDFFANIIYSLARSGEKGAAQKAESIVNRMKTRSFANANKQFPVAPTTKVYNALLHCWAKSGERDAPARAEAILESMQDNFSKGVLTIKPDVQSFTSVLDALARSRDIHAWKRAESLIASMELTGRDDVSVRPNAHAYTSLIHNYARSRDLPQKAVRAQAVLNRMKESFEIEGNVAACPNIIAYNAVLNTCEYVPLSTTNSDERQEAFRVACAAWNEIRSSSYLKATHVTYASFLGVIAKLMPRSDIRNNMAELVFKRCCNDGQVAGIVLNKLKAAAPSHYNKVMNGLGSGSLPREWIFNVKQQ